MRQECLDSRFVFDRPLPASRLVSLIGSSILTIVNLNFCSEKNVVLFFMYRYLSGYIGPFSLCEYSMKSNNCEWQQWTLTEPSETQIPTQRYGRRPYGVGLLIAGFDVSLLTQTSSFILLIYSIFSPWKNKGRNSNLTIALVVLSCVYQDMGPHIFQTCPSANYFDCKAMSIGARSQSARTYLERCMEKFSDCKMKLISLALFPHMNLFASLLARLSWISHVLNTVWLLYMWDDELFKYLLIGVLTDLI